MQLPTLDSLLADKLTAFAPSTTGVPLRKEDGTAGDVVQVVKQLFDVGMLFGEAANGTKEQNDALPVAPFNNTPWDWADGLRQVNPEAYHYWLLASRLLGISAKR